MPELNGLEATRQILKAVPDVQVLILSVHESEELGEGDRRGWRPRVHFEIRCSRELAAAVRALRQGESYFTSKVAQIALRAYLKNRVAVTPRHRLTAR